MLEAVWRFINNLAVDYLDAGTSMLLVLGGTGSGKTVALTTAFHMLSNGVSVPSGTPRLTINTKSSQERYRQTIELLTNAYREMQTSGKLPVGTSENLMYTYRLELNGRGISKMQYLDYRGGIRSEKEPDPDEQKAYQSAMSNANMIAFVIPGDLLQIYEELPGAAESGIEYELQSVKIDCELNQIESQLLQLDELNPKAPILFYVTKADYISDERRVLSLLKQLLSDYELLHGERRILGCYSTLGKNIKIDGQFRILEGMAPEGFEIPVLLAAGYRLKQLGAQDEKDSKKPFLEEIRGLNTELSQLKAKEKQLEAKLNARFIKLLAPEKKELVELREQISEKGKKLQEVEEKCGAIQSVYSTEAQGVLTYLAEACGNKIVYWDARRESKGVTDFFEDTAAMV